MNWTRPTYVRNCAFHHGFSVAIGVDGSATIPIEYNVIHHTLDMGISIRGHSNIIRYNLVALNYWACTFVPWEAPYTSDYWGAIDMHLSESVVLENNYVAGSQRIGITQK
jgi:hypothetical protein